MGVERITIAQVTVARYDVVVDTTDRKCAFEDGWASCTRVALVVYGYTRPAENVAGAGATQRTSSVDPHALRGGVRRYYFTPVSLDGGGHERLAVGKHALACSVGVIIDNARRRVHELVVWAEV